MMLSTDLKVDKMLVNIGVHRGLFSENFFTKDPEGAKRCHAIVADLLLRHGRVVFDSPTSKNEFAKIVKSRSMMPYWEKVINKSTVKSSSGVPWWMITSTKDFSSRDDGLEILLVELDTVQQIFSINATLSHEHHKVCVTRCDTPGEPEGLENLVRMANCRYGQNELDQNIVRKNYIEPFLKESSRTVIMDKFIGYVLDKTNLKWFWQLLRNSRSDHGQRELKIITTIPKHFPTEKNDLIECLQERQESLIGDCLGDDSNLESVKIYWLYEWKWSFKGKHDRHIRFDDRVIEISSGYEVLSAPQKTDAHFTYWVKDTRHTAYATITSEEKRASNAASYHFRSTYIHDMLKTTMIPTKTQRKRTY
ncbi:hypothetical protein [Frankia sp. Cj3]|uniref:hypothetical protein n=1 Tax=Frankia sp. Cj3 TaxID=2880976 RepID=UPI001EF709B6|nr:hypothetical protein [Frankia sp. Cj3]